MSFASATPSPLLAVLIVGLLVGLLVGLVLAARRYLRTRHWLSAVLVAVLAIAAAEVGGAIALSAYVDSVRENTWTFTYSLAVARDDNGTGSLVAPIPKDEHLLAGLRLEAGNANWSFIDTTRGRGLFVRFNGTATLRASVSAIPRPVALPDTSPTLFESTNCTAGPSNCTGPPTVWIFYSGPSGTRVSLVADSWYVGDYLQAGWVAYVVAPPRVPLA